MWRALDAPRSARSLPRREASVDDPRAGAPRAGAAGTVAAAPRADQPRTRVAFGGARGPARGLVDRLGLGGHERRSRPPRGRGRGMRRRTGRQWLRGVDDELVAVRAVEGVDV